MFTCATHANTPHRKLKSRAALEGGARSAVIMVDAAAVVEVLLNTATGRVLQWRLFATDETLHVPHLTDVAVAQVLRRYTVAKTLLSKRF